MKKNYRNFAMLTCACLLFSFMAFTQEGPKFITVTTIHWDKVENFSMDEWKAIEKEYFDKVTSKNELILSSLVLLHYYTADNSEIKIVTGYAYWEDIEKASERSNELAKAAWPDKAQRQAFFKKQMAYYSDMHSDEIYATLPFAKVFSEKPVKPLVYYVRQSHTATPENASNEEIEALMKEYVDAVIIKNSHILGYFPVIHSWGSDSRDLLEAFVVESLAEIEKASEEIITLEKATWPDEAKRKEFFGKMDKYSTGWHGDYIYQSVPELTK